MEFPVSFDENNGYLLVAWNDSDGITTHIHIPSNKPGISTLGFAIILGAATKALAVSIKETTPKEHLEQIEADITEKYNQFMREDTNKTKRINYD